MYYRTVIGTACMACLEEGLCIGMVSVCPNMGGGALTVWSSATGLQQHGATAPWSASQTRVAAEHRLVIVIYPLVYLLDAMILAILEDLCHKSEFYQMDVVIKLVFGTEASFDLQFIISSFASLLNSCYIQRVDIFRTK